MANQTLPDEERYLGWVTLAWTIAVITCALSVWLVATMGMVKIPRLSIYSTAPAGTETVINWTIWGWAIGQSLAALLFAALFSIANSAYRNSCKTVAMLVKQQPTPKAEDLTTIDPTSGLRVEQVRTASPLEGVLHPGYRLLRVNGQEPEDANDAAALIVKGENQLIYCNLEGKVCTHKQKMQPGPLHITFTEPS